MTGYRLHRIAAALPDAVRSGDEAGFAVLMEHAAGQAELHALIRLLARCADPAELAIAVGSAVPPKAAHRVYERLRAAGKPVPAHIRAGQRAYDAIRYEAARAARSATAKGRTAA